MIESQHREPLIVVHYLGWNMWYDEVLPITSPRLAKLGFYTGRDSIPKYKLKDENGEYFVKGVMQATITNRISDNKMFVEQNTGSRPSTSPERELEPAEREEDRARRENQAMGEQLDQKVENLFNRMQDVNYFYGNSKFSGVPVGRVVENPLISP